MTLNPNRRLEDILSLRLISDTDFKFDSDSKLLQFCNIIQYIHIIKYIEYITHTMNHTIIVLLLNKTCVLI